MPRGKGSAPRPRKAVIAGTVIVGQAEDADRYVLASISQAGGIGRHDEHGHYATLVLGDLASREEADAWKKALYRSCVWLWRHGTPVSLSRADIEHDAGGYRIRFRISDKVHARAYHLREHGSDRSKWAYDPIGRGGTQ
jgi:hypothetical protein